MKELVLVQVSPITKLLTTLVVLAVVPLILRKGIRGHWGIKNRLHWVKDVVFGEDGSRIRQGNAPANRSIILAIAINIWRLHGYSSITSAQRFLSNDIDKLLLLVE